MSRRARVLWFGTAAVLVVAGIVSAVLVGDGTGQLLALALISLGLILATSLAFLEVGLSEDRERGREQRRLTKARPARRPRRLDRMRGRRRRLS